MSSLSEPPLSPVVFNLLKLDDSDFPDVCVKCEQCMQQIRDTIKVHTSSQIKDADIAQKFVDSAMAELTAFFQRREEHC